MKTRPRLRRNAVPRLALIVPVALLLVLGFGPGVASAQLPYSRAGKLTGIDVSHWQGYIYWSAVRDAGVKFAIVKATDGRSFTDSRYARNSERADALGIRMTAYHFARPDGTYRDAVREADHFVATARLEGRHLLPVLDLEVTGGLSRDRLATWARKWLQRVEARLGVKPMIYTSPSFWKDRMGNTTWFAANGYRVLWIAHWFVDQPRVPASNWNGHGWKLWQVSNCGHIPGIDGCVDVDLYNGLDMAPLLIKNNR
jgi:lysozyme